MDLQNLHLTENALTSTVKKKRLSWDEFEKAAKKLYKQEPLRIRYTMKYIHKKNQLTLKMTDNVVCLKYKTELEKDLEKINQFINNLMQQMTSK